jgi:hypothetical protein
LGLLLLVLASLPLCCGVLKDHSKARLKAWRWWRL